MWMGGGLIAVGPEESFGKLIKQRKGGPPQANSGRVRGQKEERLKKSRGVKTRGNLILSKGGKGGR